MRRQLFNVLALALLLGVLISSGLHATHIQIGEGTLTTAFVPTYGWYDYSWSRVIYLQSEIGMAINISEISYQVSNTPDNYTMFNQRIYMKHTADSVFPNGNYVETADYTEVFDGTLVWNGSGWHTIVLDTPFAYNGTDNLEIYFRNHDGSYQSSWPQFHYTAQASRSVHRFADGTFPTTNGTLSNLAANIRLHYIMDGAPGVPVNPTPANNATAVSASTGLSWTNGDDTDNVRVLLDTVNPPVNEVYDGVAIQSLTNAQIGGELNPTTTYYWRVIPSNDLHELPGPIWNFTTDWADGSYQIGYGTINNTSTGYPAPYGNYYMGARHQMLIPVSELNAAGISGPGVISSLAFDVVTAQGNALVNFTVWVGSTTANSLTGWVGNMTQVYTTPSYAPVNGWNVHDFDLYYFWDGVSNLVVETCFNNPSWSSHSIFNQTATTGYNSTIFYRADSQDVCGNPGISGTVAQRPNMVLNFQAMEGAPGVPTNPSPANQATAVAHNTGLSWTNGENTDFVRVLFGTVNPPVMKFTMVPQSKA